MRFAVLGPLTVHGNGGPVRVGGRLRRTLLSALLLEGGAPVSEDRLTELLWGPAAPGFVGKPLHNQVLRLRQALGEPERIQAAAPGYLIRLAPGELDLDVFAGHCASGRRALAEQDWPQAARELGAALALWRGRPLVDVPALAGDIRLRELAETRLQVLQGRIEADLHLGRHPELLDELHTLVEEHPAHPAFRSQLMLALYRCDRRAEALAVYAAFRDALADELGLEPAAELRELHTRIQSSDPSLAFAPHNASRAAPRTAPHSPAGDAPRQLPADVRTFTGRVRELEDLVVAAQKAAAASGEVTGTVVISALDGMGGIGKTALAVHAAHRVGGRFPDGQLFIDLRGHADAARAVPVEEALAYLLRSLGVPSPGIPAGLAERVALYRTRLADSRTLILLDNAADAAQVRPLLPDGPGCLVLVTSRGRLLGLEGARSLTVDVLGGPEAVALLGKVAGPGRAPAGEAARELAELCGHMPLALRIVGARLRHQPELTVAGLVAELRDEDRRLDRLTDGERDLTSVFESSFAGLPEPERRALRLLGRLPGPDLDRYAAAHLFALPVPEAARLLESLLSRNLLIQQVSGRYGMHDLVRSYARTLMSPEHDEAVAARARLLAYYQHTADAAGRHHTTAIRWRPAPEFSGPAPELADTAAALAWLRAERDCLLAAVAARDTPPPRRLDLAVRIAPLLLEDGPWPEAAALHERAARWAEALGDGTGRADALRNLGLVVLSSSERERAQRAFEQARELYRAAGCRAGEADALFRIGRVLTYADEFAAAMEPERAALALFREIGDRHGEAHALQAVADTARLLGRADEALEACEAVLAIYRGLGNRQAEATALQKLGYVQAEIGELHAAAGTLEQALKIDREYGQRQAEGAVLNVLGGVLSLQGEHARADQALRRALELFRDLGYRLGSAVILTHLGQARVAAGDPAAGIGFLERAGATFGELGSDYGETEVARELGWARLALGDAAGLELLEDVLGRYRGAVLDPPGEVETLVYLGLAAVDRGEARAALAYFGEALPRARAIRRTVAEARALDGAARAHELLGDEAAARELLAAAVAHRRRMGLAARTGTEGGSAASGPVPGRPVD